MARDAVATMGTILEPDVGGRDAVHVAVISAKAGQKLMPGQHVGVAGNDTDVIVNSGLSQSVGIVDPYLEAMVQPGQRFWLYLYPRSITSLRHNWTHPSFPDVASAIPQAPADAVYARPAEKLTSERWLRDFCDGHDCPRYDTLIPLIEKALNNDGYACSDEDSYHGIRIEEEYLMTLGSDSHGEIPSEFWDHVSVVIGRKIKERPTYFSCSC